MKLKLRQLDLNLLVILDALLRELSTVAAARKLNMSQSAISGALSRLRELFDDELLRYVGRRMVPTQLALNLVEPVADILLRIQAAIQMRADFDPATTRRRFKLMMSDYAATVLMPGILPRLERAAPGATIEVRSLQGDMPMEYLEHGDVDFLIAPAHLLAPQHPHKFLFEDSFVCVAWNSNTRIAKELTMDDYLSIGHVALSSKRRHHGDDEWITSMTAVRRSIEVTAISFSSMPQFIIGTQRIATVPHHLATTFAQNYPIRILPAPFPIPTVREVLQWNSSFDADLGHRWFSTLIQEQAASIGP